MTLARSWAVCLLAGMACSAAGAALLADEAWQEGPVPTPPSFNVDALVHFEVSPNATMVYGIAPQSVSISSDRVVRYVLVARSPSGARNVFYEGIRCATAEVRTYARHNGQQWVMASDPPWQPMDARPSRHALQLARLGACDGTAVPSRAEDVLRSLRQAAPVRGN